MHQHATHIYNILKPFKDECKLTWLGLQEWKSQAGLKNTMSTELVFLTTSEPEGKRARDTQELSIKVPKIIDLKYVLRALLELGISKMEPRGTYKALGWQTIDISWDTLNRETNADGVGV